MKKLKSLLLRKILSNDEPTPCVYGPPEWYDEKGHLKPWSERRHLPEDEDEKDLDTDVINNEKIKNHD